VNKTSLGYNVSLLGATRRRSWPTVCASVQRFSEMSVLIVVIVSFFGCRRLVQPRHIIRAAPLVPRRRRASSLVAEGTGRSAEIPGSCAGSQHAGQGAARQSRSVTIAFSLLDRSPPRNGFRLLRRRTRPPRLPATPAAATALQPLQRNVYSNIQGWITSIRPVSACPTASTRTITRRAPYTVTPPCRFSAHRRAHRIAQSRCLSPYGACRAAR